jgi:hypothetical protein
LRNIVCVEFDINPYLTLFAHIYIAARLRSDAPVTPLSSTVPPPDSIPVSCPAAATEGSTAEGVCWETVPSDAIPDPKKRENTIC